MQQKPEDMALCVQHSCQEARIDEEVVESSILAKSVRLEATHGLYQRVKERRMLALELDTPI